MTVKELRGFLRVAHFVTVENVGSGWMAVRVRFAKLTYTTVARIMITVNDYY